MSHITNDRIIESGQETLLEIVESLVEMVGKKAVAEYLRDLAEKLEKE